MTPFFVNYFHCPATFHYGCHPDFVVRALCLTVLIGQINCNYRLTTNTESTRNQANCILS